MSVIRRNILWILVSQLATWIASLAALVIVPNSLGSREFGTVAYAVGFVGFFTLVAGLGTATYLARAIARDHNLVGSYVWNTVLLKLPIWALASTAAMALAYALGNRGQTLLLIAISCAGMLPSLLSEVFFGALYGVQRMAPTAMWTVAQVYFQTTFGILVLVLGGGVVVYTVVMTLGTLIPLVGTALIVRPFVRGNRVFDIRIWRLLVVGGIPLLALTSFNLIYGSLDVPILHTLAGSDPVGWYTVALRWVGIPLFVTTAVVSAYFPVFSLHGNPLTSEFAPLVNRAVRMVLFVTIPASVGLIFTADSMIRFIYDREFDSSIVLIQILAIGLPITALDTVLVTALVASDRVKRYLLVAGIAACLNPIASFVAIKLTDSRYGNGAIGAAIVTVATELGVMAGALYFRSPGVFDRTEVGRIGRITAATAAMVPLLLLSEGWPLALRVVLALGVYALASLAVGSVTIGEMRDEIGQMARARRERPADGAGVAESAGEPVEAAEIDSALAPVPLGEVRPQA